jgi:hypothetical protein
MTLLGEMVFPEAYADFADQALPIPDDYPLQEGLDGSFETIFEGLLIWRKEYTEIWLHSRRDFVMLHAS